MAKLGRPGMSDQFRAQLWQMSGSGKSFSEISRAIGHPPGSIFTVIKQTGGYVPRPRSRRPGSLALSEREEISRGLARGDSLRQIARALGRAPSTVSREIARNRGRRKYRAIDADDRGWRRARRPKACLLARNPALRTYVADRLAEDWSPEQIAGVLARDAPIGTGVRVSHETIYKSLFVQSRGVLANRQRADLPARPGLATSARRPGCSVLLHPPLPAADQREGRTLQPDSARGVGLRPTLHQLSRPGPGLTRLAAHLQPSPHPHRDRRTATHQSHPRQRPRGTEQLALSGSGPAGSHRRPLYAVTSSAQSRVRTCLGRPLPSAHG